jgi:predicted HTH transcriptional regulator
MKKDPAIFLGHILDSIELIESFSRGKAELDLSVLRNTRIGGMLHPADYIEKMGTGIRKMQRLMSESGLPPLEFSFTSLFTVTFRKPAAVNGESDR